MSPSRLAFRKLSIAEPTIVELREWSRIDEELKVEHVRLTNRLKHQLWRYYPQMLELADDVGANWFLDLFEAVPTPEKAANVREKTIARILKNHRVRRFDASHVLAELRKPALAVAPGTIEATTARIRGLIERLRLINGQLTDATLLAEASDTLQRRDYHALRLLCGSAPVTRRSGKSCVVVRRYACNHRLRNATYHWAQNAIQHDLTSRAKYVALRAKGHGHARALRSYQLELDLPLCFETKSTTIARDPFYSFDNI